MDLLLPILFFLIALVIVVKGADVFVSAASWVSDVTGISKILIGATVVAIATSGPELFVSLIAAMENKADMSVGNIVGSHLCNLGLGFSLIAFFRFGKNNEKLFAPNGIIMIIAALLLLFFSFEGELNYIHGIIFMIIFAFFTFINIRLSEVDVNNSDEVINNDNTNQAIAKKPQRKATNKKEITINVLKFIMGIAAIIIGSKIIVDNATIFAKKMGVSEMFIGLTIVAIGTSLPEIVTTIAAILKKEDDLGIGNIIGSCIFNNLFILAIAAFVTNGLAISDSIITDLLVAITLMVIAVVPTIISKKIYRWQGISLFVIYIGYVAYLGIFTT